MKNGNRSASKNILLTNNGLFSRMSQASETTTNKHGKHQNIWHASNIKLLDVFHIGVNSFIR